MAFAGTAWIKYLGDYSQLGTGSEKAVQKMAGNWKSLSKSLLGPALAVGVTAGLTKLGSDFQKAYKTIRTGTGETGASLRSLQDDFKAVVRTRPEGLDQVAKALTRVHQRTGLTGTGLQDLTRNMLRLGSITGKDVTGAIDAASGAFGAWQVPAGQMQRRLDEIYRASQKTGTGFEDIAGGLQQFGQPLRQMGFSFEQSTAMLAQFQKEGLNTSGIMAGLKRGLVTAAKAGEAPAETFARVTKSIKDAGSTSAANAQAIKVFGARAGPELAASIRQGRFEVGGLTKDIASGSDTIEKSAKDTATFSGKWKTFVNAMKVGFEPVATKLFTGLTDAMTAAMPVLTGVADAVGKLAGNVDILVPALATLLAMVATGKIVAGINAIAAAFAPEGAAALIAVGWPVLIVGALVALGAALVVAYQKVSWFHDAVDAAWQGLLTGLRFLARNWKVIVGGLAAVFLGPVGLIIGAFVLLYRRFDGFRAAVDTVVRGLVVFGKVVWQALQPVIRAVVSLGVAVGRYLLEPFRTAIAVIVKLIHGDWRGAIGELLGLPMRLLRLYATVWAKLGQLVWQGLLAAGRVIGRFGPTVLGAIGRLLSKVPGLLATLGIAIGKAFIKAVPALLAALGRLAAAALDALGRLTVDVLASLGRLGVQLLVWAAKALGNLGMALLRMVPNLLGWVVTLAIQIPLKLVQLQLALFNWVATTAVQLATAFARWVPAALSWLAKVLVQLPGQLARLGLALVTWIARTAVTLVQTFGRWERAGLAWLWNVITQLPGQLARLATAMWNGFRTVEWTIIRAVQRFVPAALGWIGRTLATLPGQIARIGQVIWDGLTKLPGLIARAAGGIYRAFTNVGKGILDAIVSGLTAGGKAVGNFAATLGKSVFGWIKDHVFKPLADFKVSIGPKHFTPFKALLSAVGIKGLAGGGLVNRPQLALVGEAGPELVLPLTDPQRVADLLRQYAPQLITTAAAGAAVGATPATPGPGAGTDTVFAWADAVVERLTKLPAQIAAATMAPLTAWGAWFKALFAQLTATVATFTTITRVRLATWASREVPAATVPALAAWAARMLALTATWTAQMTALLAAWLARTSGQLRAAVGTWAALGRAAGAAYVRALTGQLSGGTTAVARIVGDYAKKLAGGLNPILKAIGQKPIRLADGAVVTYATGGLSERHVAQVAPAGAYRVWAEPETGGEAYIPLGGAKRARSKAITEAVVNRFGGVVAWLRDGGVTGDTHGLNPTFLQRVNTWSNAVGQPFHITSGYRDIGQQQALYAKYLSGAGNLAAKPGSSMHNYGLAIDGPHWGNHNPGAFGLVYRVRGEPWHVEPVEARAWRGMMPAAGWGDTPGVSWASLPHPPALGHSGLVWDVADKAMKYVYAQSVAWAASALATSAAGAPYPTTGAFGGGSAVAIGQRMAAARGWTGAQWQALYQLWMRESGWRVNADNPTSSAFGIPQALPGSKMAAAGADWRTNPVTQIAWGLGYIAGSYGSPLAAWAHSQRFNWYGHGGLVFAHARSFDRGGTLATGLNLVRNDTGGPERLVPAGRGAAVSITEAHFHEGIDYDAFLRKTAFMVKAGRM